MRNLVVVVAGLLICGGAKAQAREASSPQYSRLNGVTVFVAGSNNSEPLFMGSTFDRLLYMAGGTYTRRIFQFHNTEIGYHVEAKPVVFESDPILLTTLPVSGGGTTLVTSTPLHNCADAIKDGEYPGGAGALGNKCGRRWTFGQSFSPIGFRISGLKNKPVQPYFLGTLGYMYTSRPIPTTDAEPFNFVFDFGVGVEVWKRDASKRSVSVDFRLHHLSNRDTAGANPGIDSMMLRASYGFGH